MLVFSSPHTSAQLRDLVVTDETPFSRWGKNLRERSRQRQFYHQFSRKERSASLSSLALTRDEDAPLSSRVNQLLSPLSATFCRPFSSSSLPTKERRQSGNVVNFFVLVMIEKVAEEKTTFWETRKTTSTRDAHEENDWHFCVREKTTSLPLNRQSHFRHSYLFPL